MTWRTRLWYILILVVLVAGAMFPPFWLLLLLATIVDKQEETKRNNNEAFKQANSHISDDYDVAMFRAGKKDYMDGPIWDKKRKARLKLDHYTCQSCGATDVPLHVHHTGGYADIPNESLTWLVSVCEDCHKLQHEHYGYPSTMKDYNEWNAPLI